MPPTSTTPTTEFKQTTTTTTTKRDRSFCTCCRTSTEPAKDVSSQNPRKLLKMTAENDFCSWFSSDRFSNLPVLQENQEYKASVDGRSFDCFRDPSTDLCFVRHSRMHNSRFGWIEDCSCAQLEGGLIGATKVYDKYERVAIKIFDLRRTFGTEYQEHSIGELDIHYRLNRKNCPSICPLLKLYRGADKVYAVYPLFEGGDAFENLSALCDKNRTRLEESQTRLFMLGACEALACCHKARFAHRDISLENFVLDKPGVFANPVLIDFGVSCKLPLAYDGLLTHPGAVGKAKYMAPELHADPKVALKYDAKRADIFSLGVVLLLLTISMEPWETTSRTDARFHRMIVRGDLGLVLRMWGIVPSPALLDLLTRMMHINPLQRPSLTEIVEHEWMRGKSL